MKQWPKIHKRRKSFYSNFSADGSTELPKLDEGRYEKVLLSDGDVEIEGYSMTANKLVFEGTARARAVLLESNGSYVSTDFSFPIRYETSLDNVEEAICSYTCQPLGMKLTVNGDRLTANAEIGINAMVFDKVAVNTVDQIAIDKNSAKPNGNENIMILYYPEKNETLWSVSKKYGISGKDIVNANKNTTLDPLPRVIVIPSSL